MKNIFLTYVISQLLSTAFGLAVIESIKPVVDKKIYEKGYTLKNKNSLYNFNDKIINFIRGFIPFYYLRESLKYIKGSSEFSKLVEEQLKNGKYIKIEEMKNMQENEIKEEIKYTNDKIFFNSTEKYKATRRDTSIYDIEETPMEFALRETKEKKELHITPFISNEVIEHKIVKSNVSKEDIAKAIVALSHEELELLKEKINDLMMIKKYSNTLTLEKDVA